MDAALRRATPMTDLAIETWLRFFVWLALGLVVYAGYGRHHARLATQPERTAARR